MQTMMRINDQISVGAQPSIDELENLAKEGFKTVVNFRAADEEGQPVSPEEVGKLVRKMGLEYIDVYIFS